MPRKTQDASRKSGRHHRRSYSSSSSSSYYSSSSSDFQAKPLRHASTMPVPMQPHPTVPPRAVQATLPPFSTLHLNIHSTQNVQMKSRSAYCKVFVASTPMVENTMFAGLSGTQHQTFKTNSVQVNNGQPEWNSTFEIRINDPRVDILSILVKNQQLLYCPIVGVCVICMKNLIGAHSVDQWFALRRGPFQTGHIRLQMLLEKIEQPTLSPQGLFVDCCAAPMARPIAVQQGQYTQSDRVRSLDDGYQQRKKEKRRLRELKDFGRKQRKHREKDDQKISPDDNQADTFDNAVVYDIAQDRSVHGDENRQTCEVRSERSGSFQSPSSHDSVKSGNSSYRRRVHKASSVRSARQSSDQSLGGLDRLALDNDLYGQLPLYQQVGTSLDREFCKSDSVPEADQKVGDKGVISTGDCDFNMMRTSPTTAQQKVINDENESKPDSGFSSSSSLPSSVSSGSRRHRRKQKKKRREHRRRKHRHAQEAFPPTLPPVIPTEIPTYPSSSPIGVLPPPPPSSNAIAVGKLATVASRVASIALLGADYTKAFTNVVGNQAAATAVANAAVSLEGIPVVSEDNGFDAVEME